MNYIDTEFNFEKQYDFMVSEPFEISQPENSASERRSDVAEVGQRFESLRLEERCTNIVEVDQRLESLRLEERDDSEEELLKMLPTEKEMEAEFKNQFIRGGVSGELLYKYIGGVNVAKKDEFLEWFPFLRDVEPLLTKYSENY